MADFAAEFGVAPQTINKLLRNGTLAGMKRNGRMKLDWNTQKDLYYHLRKKSGQKVKPIGDPEHIQLPEDSEELSEVGDPAISNGEIRTIVDARFQLEKYKALKAKEEYELTAGNSITVEEVEQTWAELGTSLKKSIMALPARIGPLLAGETDPHKTKSMLKAELTKCLLDTVAKYRPSPASEGLKIDEDLEPENLNTPAEENPFEVKQKKKKRVVKKKKIKKKVARK